VVLREADDGVWEHLAKDEDAANAEVIGDRLVHVWSMFWSD